MNQIRKDLEGGLGPWVFSWGLEWIGRYRDLLSREVSCMEIGIKVTLATVFEKRW